MAATIKDSVYKAIDVIVGKRIEDLHLDKTIEATVEECLNLVTGKYRLKYGSGVFDAYAGNDDVYMPNTAVYVLIPENDFNQKKTILGKANTGTQTNTEEIQSVASMYSGYSIIGQNILYPTNNTKNRFGLKSWEYKPPTPNELGIEDGIILYDANQNSEYNLLQIDNERLKVYLEETKGFLFSGKFKTNFVNHNLTGKEDYGLIFNIALRNGKTSFSTMQERWDVQEPKTICTLELTDDNIDTITEERRLNYYKDEIENILYPTQEQINTLINENIVEYVQDILYNFVQKQLQPFVNELNFVDAETLELANLYIQLINELVNYTVNELNQPITLIDLQKQYTKWFTDPSYAFQEEEYSIILNTNNMTGDIYHFINPTYQYKFIEIDASTFIRINSIYFYHQNFKKDGSLAGTGTDILVQDISMTCIKYLNNINGDYRLDLTYTDIYFDKYANDKDSLTITAKISYKDQDVTDYSQIMWFKKNNNITPTSEAYSMYAGVGWEHITTKIGNYGFDRSSTFTTKAEDNLVYRNKYKVIGMYKSATIVQQEFIIYNNNYQHNIELISDSGAVFGEGSGNKNITCMLDNSIDISLNKYQFTWYKELEDGTRYQIRDAAGIEQLKKEIADVANYSMTERQLKKIELSAISTIQWETNSNIITVSATSVPRNSKINIVCLVSSILDTDQLVDIGEADITLTSGYTVTLKNYYIEIINGNQVFQYNESGISPSSNIYENPLVPEKLSCNFYDPNGGLINPLRYSVSWQIPLTNTLINVDTNNLTYNIATDVYDILQSDTCEFNIDDEYNYNYTNNQIICMVEFDDGEGLVTYRQPTNFFFGKVGDDGTNGTDVVAKIDVIYNNHQNLNNSYNNNTLLNEPLTLKIEEKQENEQLKYNYIWNNGLTIDDSILQLQLFRKNNIVDNKEYHKVNWSILNNGLTSKYWRVQNVQDETTGAKQAILIFDTEKNPKGYTNYIIKAQADLQIQNNKYQTYYNFYPICTDFKYNVQPHQYSYQQYNEEGYPVGNPIDRIVYNDYDIGIDRARTLRQVVYNSDGRNPLYDKNLGVGLTFKNLDYPRTIVWEPHGGVILDDKPDEEYASFAIGKTISYVNGSNSNQIDNLLADLEYHKKQEIDQQIQKQQNTGITILQNRIGETVEDFSVQYQNISNNLTNLLINRDQVWQNFFDQYYLNVTKIYDELFNTIDDVIEGNNWVIEDYIYLNDNLYYSHYNAFLADIQKYLTGKFDIDTPDDAIGKKSSSMVIEFQNSIDELGKTLQQLYLKNVDSERDQEVWKNIEQNFTSLIDLIIIGYEIYKNIHYKRYQELYNNITTNQEKQTELNQQLKEYTKAQSLLITGDTTSIIETINKILFEDSLEYANLNNDILLSFVLLIKQQFQDEINMIVEKYNSQLTFLTNISIDESDPTFCSIIPNEVYNGEYPNQYVKIKIYQGLFDKPVDNEYLEHELIIPIHMSLNTYGLASLNAWDGNSVEINEEEGYVLAPQIGAGIKHTEDNTFTGVLMGTEKTFDDAEGQEEIGLLGYSHGKRSIFLDATTGNATFGLPENDAADVSNPLTEGRIELRPGGTSSISKWNFDSRSLYRVSTDDEEEAILQSRSYIQQNTNTSLGPPYEDAPLYAHGSIPHTKQGILLSALPAYASFKGRILTNNDQEEQRVNYVNANTSVREGDTFELQIDPNDSRFFSLYEHSTRINEGYGTCDTLSGYQQNGKYPITQDEFNNYFRMFIDISAPQYYDIDRNNTIILTQRYLQLNTNNEMRQVFRPLAYLYQNNNNNKWYWKIINTAINKRGRETEEQVIGLLYQYKNWQDNNQKQTVWKYITFVPTEEYKLKDIEVQLEYSNNELINISLIDDTIINENTLVWHRYKKAGIDATGKFVAEGVGTGAVGLGLNDIQAFNTSNLFIGANIESNNGTVAQFFIDKLSTQPTSPLFISSTKNLTGNNQDEGRRPIRIYAGRDYNDLNTGIFVGQTVEKNPIQKIAKIELSQTGPDDNKIILSALGTLSSTEEQTNQSILTLVSSSDTNQVGSLIHTGNWTTNIGTVYSATIGETAQILIKGNKGQNNFDVRGTFNSNLVYDNGTYYNRTTITKNELKLQNNTNNILNLRNNNKTLLYGFNGVEIIGGYNNKNTNIAGYGLRLSAYHSTEGILLTASHGNGGVQGDTILKLLSASTDTGARFSIFAGSHSYIYSANWDSPTKYGVCIGPNLVVSTNNSKPNTSGLIYGNGTNISNTAAGKSSGPTAAVTVSGWSGTGTIKVPRVTMSTNGRPTFSEYNLTITMPSKPTDYGQAISDLQTAVSGLQQSVKNLQSSISNQNNHYHQWSIYGNILNVTKSGNYVTNVSINSDLFKKVLTDGPHKSQRR